ncbi:CRISPR-associated endonuclease Cas1 [Collinsella tanakaei]|nr:CRISPR-associated endonuclease Cas1 [Collinsella tanakaei]
MRGRVAPLAGAWIETRFSQSSSVSSWETGFFGRSRRPPKDPVNAALSPFHSMPSREPATACEPVGPDPQLGCLHARRPGRASLALDLIEELRARTSIGSLPPSLTGVR